ncbi:MAG: DUF1846 domain-containing protein [Spirochaetes bacterium]|nr:DUF1846 domain-containing protein [Spirochaetota bacterium]MBU0954439.1 DUF1846 domain-containing protein [Spirochaetota bacterium]
MQIAFDNELYIREQANFIRERMAGLQSRLYLEFGGKLLHDFHAARVLPGYDPNVKLRLLKELQNDADIVLCIHAGAIEQRKIRADYGITYDADAMKLIDDLSGFGLAVSAVVITRWEGQRQAKAFKTKLENRGLRVYTHAPTRGYPTDVELIVSEEGYGANPRIEVSKPLVVVTGPGPGSGKMATCLSQVYHDHLAGANAMYAKFETFPIWSLPLKHPVNLAYEAATLDLRDVNLIDPFHLEATGQTAINYNRDVESFPILKGILERITGARSVYRSPTEMGVNRAGFAIINDEAAREAARQEVVRRYFRTACEHLMGLADNEALAKAERLLQELEIRPEYRPVVLPARQAAAERAEKAGPAPTATNSSPTIAPASQADLVFCGAALQLPDGQIVTGKNSSLLHAPTAAVINGLKQLAGLPDGIHLLSPLIIESIARFKTEVGSGKTPSLDVDEALIALAISAALTPMVQACLDRLHELRGCQMHLTHLPSPGDEAGLRRLGVNLTADPVYASRRLFEG